MNEDHLPNQRDNSMNPPFERRASSDDSSDDSFQQVADNTASPVLPRKRQRSENESENAVQEEATTHRVEIGNNLSSSASSSSSEEINNLRPILDDSDHESDGFDTTTTSSGGNGDAARREDPSLAWTNFLCKPPNTRNFQTLKWLQKRALGIKSSVIDGCSCLRKEVQASSWMIGRWKLYHQLSGHEGCVNAVSFNDSGSLIASGSDDLFVIIWNWNRRQIISRFDSGHTANVFQSKFLPFSSDLHIVTCARDGQIRLAQLSTTGDCRYTRHLGQHQGPAHKLSLDPLSPHSFYSCGEDSRVYLFDVREEKPNKLFVTKERSDKVALYSIHANPVNEYEFLTSGRDSFIRSYDRRYCSAPTSSSDRPSKKFCPPHLNRDRNYSKHVTCAVYSNEGKRIIGSYNDDDIYLFDTAQNDGEDAVRKYRGHRNYATVKGVNFYGPNSEYVVSGSDCGNVFVWETDSANIINVFPADEGGVVNVLEPHPHDPILATSGLDHDIKIWAPARDFPVAHEYLSGIVGKLARKNADNRKSTFADDVDGPLPSIAWILMEAFQRGRVRTREARDAQSIEESDENNGDESLSSESTSDTDDENQDQTSRRRRRGDHGPVRIQCAQQ